MDASSFIQEMFIPYLLSERLSAMPAGDEGWLDLAPKCRMLMEWQQRWNGYINQ